eukprot:2581879-Pyramimonas_sp.AAC.2
MYTGLWQRPWCVASGFHAQYSRRGRCRAGGERNVRAIARHGLRVKLLVIVALVHHVSVVGVDLPRFSNE